MSDGSQRVRPRRAALPALPRSPLATGGSCTAAKPLLFVAALAAGLAGRVPYCRCAGRQPGRDADPQHRRLDLAHPVPDAGRHAAAPMASGWQALARLRRMLGLFTFFYGVAALPVLCLAGHGPGPGRSCSDIQAPFILVGTSALLLMLPLAATSFNRCHALAGCGTLAARCTVPSTPWPCWPCCTSSGCAAARTISARCGSTLR
jgi:hypothetical protein